MLFLLTILCSSANSAGVNEASRQLICLEALQYSSYSTYSRNSFIPTLHHRVQTVQTDPSSSLCSKPEEKWILTDAAEGVFGTFFHSWIKVFVLGIFLSAVIIFLALRGNLALTVMHKIQRPNIWLMFLSFWLVENVFIVCTETQSKHGKNWGSVCQQCEVQLTASIWKSQTETTEGNFADRMHFLRTSGSESSRLRPIWDFLRDADTNIREQENSDMRCIRQYVHITSAECG